MQRCYARATQASTNDDSNPGGRGSHRCTGWGAGQGGAWECVHACWGLQYLPGTKYLPSYWYQVLTWYLAPVLLDGACSSLVRGPVIRAPAVGVSWRKTLGSHHMVMSTEPFGTLVPVKMGRSFISSTTTVHRCLSSRKQTSALPAAL